MEDVKFMCPDCLKQTEFMSGYHHGDTYVAIFHCEECMDGIDSEWEVTYKEDGTKNIRRYYFG